MPRYKQRGHQKVSPDKVASDARSKTRSKAIVPLTSTTVNVEPKRPARVKARPVTLGKGESSWTKRRVQSLSPRQQALYHRAIRVLGSVRRGRVSLNLAAQGYRRDYKGELKKIDKPIDVRTVLRRFPNDFKKAKGSPLWKTTSSDKHVRKMRGIDFFGTRDVVVNNSREAEQQREYLNAVRRFLRGDQDNLDDWKGKKIGGLDLITDGEELQNLALAGALEDLEANYSREGVA